MTATGLGLGIPFVGNTFVPTNISGAVLWLRADLGVATGGTFTWGDQSGHSNNFSQSTAIQQPTPVNSNASFGGRPTLNFNSANGQKLLGGGGLSALTAAEIFIVWKPVGTVGNAHGQWGTSASGDWYSFSTGTDVFDSFGSSARMSYTTGQVISALHLLNMISTSTEWTANTNGTQQFTTGTNTVAFTASPIIAFATAGGTLNGDMAEIILYNRKLASSERLQLRTYIGARYGFSA